MYFSTSSQLYLPERISGLGNLAYNLWWSWHPSAQVLFEMLSPRGWIVSRHNPVLMLHQLYRETLEKAACDPQFLRSYDTVMAKFEADMDTRKGWFRAQMGHQYRAPIAYFSAEYGLHHSLPFYAGGLGFLAGDFLKESSDLGIPMVAVGFMYPQGYLRQRLSSDGWQGCECDILDREHAPIKRVLDLNDEPLEVTVPKVEPSINLEVWKVQMGSVSLYLIDTALESNSPWNRCISDRLYVGDPEQRLRQEIVLGLGGMWLLKVLGIEPAVLHLNEGHPVFAVLERVRQLMDDGMDFRQAFEEVRRRTLFTTHTSVEAGHDVFQVTLVEKYFRPYLSQLGIEERDFLRLGAVHNKQGFNLSAFAFRCAAHHNAVSRRHEEVTRTMWSPLLEEEGWSLEHITNGVHLSTWLAPEMESLLNRYLDSSWLSEHDNKYFWGMVDDIPDRELWQIHQELKTKLIIEIRERARRKWRFEAPDTRQLIASGVMLDHRALTIGFARRFATYKRATLILRDVERIKNLLTNEWWPVQIVFAGKAHPDDSPAKRLIQEIVLAAEDPSFGGRLAFLEDYDEQLARYLVQGVDMWLNTPLPPMEACGTSGMKAAVNGVPQLSILDGWWLEGYTGRNGWAISSGGDQEDAEAIYRTLEKEVVPLYYRLGGDGVPHGWTEVMKESMKTAAPQFCTRRMAKEYARIYQRAMEN